ncbi:hypothetical protein ACX27_01195 [Nostoc piscinale CENA21]|uniref:Putative restriction endonuclease domain-containing protein n=1 Tax=Nostoc piscinale CENA21 TaxID=224013 RepID=A0A0M3V4A0_9NOSO|nr:Uma2 family endonuclease [Nostoc piscinale]ALF51773.1 hypothetical protein ACX27_01195 [Nostoc piscinale CENA21]
MTVVIPVAKPVSKMQLAPGSTVTIPDVSWSEFEAILAELGHKRRSRVAYIQGTLESMVPLPDHEIPKDLLSDIVKALVKFQGRRYEPFGSTTFKREGIAGVEPDACFYIQNYQRMIGRRRLEPDDPPPDLAIQSDVTSKTKLDAYAAVGVPELWVYDNGTLKIYILRDGIYLVSDYSPLFGEIPIKQVIPTFVERAWQVGNLQALEEFEVAIANR